MSIKVACDKCDWQATVKDDRAGKKGKCPTCGEPVLVPVPSAIPDDPDQAAYAALLEGDDDPTPSSPVSYSAPVAPKPYSLPNHETKRDVPAARTTKSPATKFDYRPKERVRERRGITISGGVIVGLLMMGGAALWFFVGLAAGRIFFYPPILFIIGLINLIRSLFGHED